MEPGHTALQRMPVPAVAKTVEAYGKVDVLVNNAGVLEEGLKPIDRVTDEDMDGGPHAGIAPCDDDDLTL